MKGGILMESYESYNFIKKYKVRSIVVWISCFDKARNVDEIASIWNYADGNILNIDRVPQQMVELGLLRIERIKKRYIYYRSSFERFFEVLECWNEKENMIMKEMYRNFVKSKDIFQGIMEREEYRKIFLDLDLLRKTIPNKDFIGILGNFVGIVVNGIYLLVLMKYAEEHKQKRSEVIDSFAKIPLFPGWDNEKYYESVKSKLDDKTYEILSKDIEKTLFYKYFSERIKFLRRFLFK
jgi:hypothetical protein